MFDPTVPPGMTVINGPGIPNMNWICACSRLVIAAYTCPGCGRHINQPSSRAQR